MIFVISRTSIWNCEEKPCDGAFIKELTYLNFRAVKTLKEAEKYPWFDDWYNHGINHREENGMIVCNAKKKRGVWCMEVGSLNELVALYDKCGDIVITDAQYKEVPIGIEIYDDYRE